MIIPVVVNKASLSTSEEMCCKCDKIRNTILSEKVILQNKVILLNLEVLLKRYNIILYCSYFAWVDERDKACFISIKYKDAV